MRLDELWYLMTGVMRYSAPSWARDTMHGRTGAARSPAPYKIFYNSVSRDFRLGKRPVACEASTSGAVWCCLQWSILPPLLFWRWCVHFHWFYSKDWYWITFVLFKHSNLRIRQWQDKFEGKSMFDCSEGDICIFFRFYSKKSNGLVLKVIVFVRAQQTKNQTMTGNRLS